MKSPRAFLRFAVLAAAALLPVAAPAQKPLKPKTAADLRVQPAGSRAYIVGVGQHSDDGLPDRPLAVNDAIDTAWLLSVELGMMPPANVTLFLSGDPTPRMAGLPDAAKRLDDLRGRGTRVLPATVVTLLGELRQPAFDQVRPGGLLVVAWYGGARTVPKAGEHLLTTDTEAGRVDLSSFPANHLIRLLEKTPTEKKLLLLDLYRSDAARYPGPVRGGGMPQDLRRRLDEATGLAVLSSSQPGMGSYDEPSAGNGLLAATLRRGLDAERGVRAEGGLLTFGQWQTTLEKTADEWVKKHRPADHDNDGTLGYRGTEEINGYPIAEYY